ncbi:MAG: DEAD/DEAH box helicase [Burkholderiales bacterium]|nr:DEAD/DEAH box helicase [Burkholderiales bacterium]
MQFSDLGLAAELLRAVEEQGYSQPTPIQEQAIPPILLGQDMMAGAQTGTGKTAAFTLPLLQRLLPQANNGVSPARHPVRALILAPTRELAAQVWESVRTYGQHTMLRSTCVYGGVSIDPQMKELQAGVEVLVATPGRLLDLVQQRSANLSQVQILVLDEADRMLDMGFMPDLRRIIGLLPAQRQNLMFSATFPDDIKKFADQVLKSPVRIQVAARNTVAELITHSAFKVDPLRKRELLANLVRLRDMRQVLVFTSTKLSANRLSRQLERDGFNCAALHSDKTQGERMQALADFKEGKVTVLVATDIAARGLDIEQLPHVINYELPPNPEDYIHRIGRTGRAGMTGEAISLVAPDEQDLLQGIEKMLKKKIPMQPLPADLLDGQPARHAGRAASRRLAAPAREPSAAVQPALFGAGDQTASVPGKRRPQQIAALFLPPVVAKQD